MLSAETEQRSLALFQTEFGVDFHECTYSDCCHAAYYGPDEEVTVADSLLQPAGSHSGQHHAKCHEAGANCVVRRLVFAFGEVNEIEHVGSEPESIAKLLDEYADMDYQQ